MHILVVSQIHNKMKKWSKWVHGFETEIGLRHITFEAIDRPISHSPNCCLTLSFGIDEQ